MEKEKMTREQVETFREGWRLVKEIELIEAKHATYPERWHDLNAIFNFAYELGLIQPTPEEELAPIRERWARLKAGYP